jgi:type II secretory pathway pseudopilin PulG
VTERKNKKYISGFTLVETLVVIGIVMIMTTTLIAYTRSSGKQITLYTEQARLIGLLNRAKSLALQRESAEHYCAYGVRFTGGSSYELVRVPNEQKKDESYKPCDVNKIESFGELQNMKTPIVISNSPQPIIFEGPYVKVHNSGDVVLQVSGSSPVLEARVGVTPFGGISSK